MRCTLPLAHRRLAGFSLIELLVTMAIVGILASIAYPSFMGAIRKSRRADAVAALVRVQHAQERWRANNASYATGIDPTGADATQLLLPTDSPDGHYTLSLANVNATTYTVLATAKSTSSQAADSNCVILQVLMQAGGGINQGLMQYGSKDSSGTLTVGPGNPCWAK